MSAPEITHNTVLLHCLAERGRSEIIAEDARKQGFEAVALHHDFRAAKYAWMERLILWAEQHKMKVEAGRTPAEEEVA